MAKINNNKKNCIFYIPIVHTFWFIFCSKVQYSPYVCF